jgi:uncharacterized membrane protein YeaQ/YmgE (transglycosylase-associated protein family)
MTLVGLIVLLIIAAIAGALGQAISGYSIGGCLGAIVIGFLGAWLGVWLAGQLGLPHFFTLVVDGQSFPLVWAVIGAAILSLIFGLLLGGRRRVI